MNVSPRPDPVRSMPPILPISDSVSPRSPRAFSLVELLTVIAVIALLIGILLPARANARATSRASICASRLHQLGVALTLYLNDYPDTLPQATTDIGGNQVVVGTLFGGKKGSLPAYSINTMGAHDRPLNRYILDAAAPDDADPGVFEVEAFHSPSDVGGVIPGIGRTNSMYDLLGSSYAINDHALKQTPGEQEVATLVPNTGGKMPLIANTSKTWVLGSYPIYNADGGGDRQHYWYLGARSTAGPSAGAGAVRANLLFADWHVGSLLPVPATPTNTTKQYTFFPG